MSVTSFVLIEVFQVLSLLLLGSYYIGLGKAELVRVMREAYRGGYKDCWARVVDGTMSPRADAVPTVVTFGPGGPPCEACGDPSFGVGFNHLGCFEVCRACLGPDAPGSTIEPGSGGE